MPRPIRLSGSAVMAPYGGHSSPYDFDKIGGVWHRRLRGERTGWYRLNVEQASPPPNRSRGGDKIAPQSRNKWSWTKEKSRT